MNCRSTYENRALYGSSFWHCHWLDTMQGMVIPQVDAASCSLLVMSEILVLAFSVIHVVHVLVVSVKRSSKVCVSYSPTSLGSDWPLLLTPQVLTTATVTQ